MLASSSDDKLIITIRSQLITNFIGNRTRWRVLYSRYFSDRFSNGTEFFQRRSTRTLIEDTRNVGRGTGEAAFTGGSRRPLIDGLRHSGNPFQEWRMVSADIFISSAADVSTIGAAVGESCVKRPATTPGNAYISFLFASMR